MKNTELKPCPFCGGKAICRDNIISFFTIKCNQCHAVVSFVGREKKQLCVKAWNRRIDK